MAVSPPQPRIENQPVWCRVSRIRRSSFRAGEEQRRPFTGRRSPAKETPSFPPPSRNRLNRRFFVFVGHSPCRFGSPGLQMAGESRGVQRSAPATNGRCTGRPGIAFPGGRRGHQRPIPGTSARCHSEPALHPGRPRIAHPGLRSVAMPGGRNRGRRRPARSCAGSSWERARELGHPGASLRRYLRWRPARPRPCAGRGYRRSHH